MGDFRDDTIQTPSLQRQTYASVWPPARTCAEAYGVAALRFPARRSMFSSDWSQSQFVRAHAVLYFTWKLSKHDGLPLWSQCAAHTRWLAHIFSKNTQVHKTNSHRAMW